MLPNVLNRLILSRYHRIENQVYQNLYKAENLGFYSSIYEGNIISQTTRTVVNAELFSKASSLARARNVLELPEPVEMGFLAQEQAHRKCLLPLPSSLVSLDIIAQAHELGWRLVLESTPFVQRTLEPVANRTTCDRFEFNPTHTFTRRIRTEVETFPATRILFICFPDRPCESAQTSLPVTFLGQDFLFSMAEGVFTHLPLDLILGLQGLRVVVHEPARTAKQVSSTELAALLQAQACSLEQHIRHYPNLYLGWETLYTRAKSYLEVVGVNRKNLLQSLLCHYQLNGAGLAPEIYTNLMKQLKSLVPAPV